MFMIFIVLIVVALLLVFLNVLICKIMYQALTKETYLLNKNAQNFHLLAQWLNLKRKNPDFLLENLRQEGYLEIAIYGYGYLGRQLYQELSNSDIQVKYFIDRQPMDNIDGIPVLKPEQEFPEADVIIVSVIDLYYEIVEQLAKVNIGVYRSLEDFIY